MLACCCLRLVRMINHPLRFDREVSEVLSVEYDYILFQDK